MQDSADGSSAYNWKKPPSLQQLSKDMISISSQVSVMSKDPKTSSQNQRGNNMLPTGRYLIGQEAIPGNNQTPDDKTTSKDSSNLDADNLSDVENLVIKPKTQARKSNFSSPESNQNPMSLFQARDTSKLNKPVIQPFSIQSPSKIKPNPPAPRKSAIQMNAVVSEVNNVYHPDFNFERFKGFAFSRPIRNKLFFQKFLEEIKADVDIVLWIDKKEPCPTKVPLRHLDKSKFDS